MANDALTYSLLFGSYREPALGRRVLCFLQSQLQARGHTVHVLDAAAHNLPLFGQMYKEFDPGEAPAPLPHFANCLESSDGIVLVAGEYNHSIQPGLKNLLDLFQSEFLWRIAALCTYSPGQFGGMRNAMHLRAMCGELGMPTISSIFGIPAANKKLQEDGANPDGDLLPFCERYLNELDWYAQALRAQRQQGTPF